MAIIFKGKPTNEIASMFCAALASDREGTFEQLSNTDEWVIKLDDAPFADDDDAPKGSGGFPGANTGIATEEQTEEETVEDSGGFPGA